MNNVIRSAFRKFKVIVTHDAGVWVGVCDELCIATEAPTFEALTERVWSIAPEMAQENSLQVEPSNMRLVFVHELAAPSALVL